MRSSHTWEPHMEDQRTTLAHCTRKHNYFNNQGHNRNKNKRNLKRALLDAFLLLYKAFLGMSASMKIIAFGSHYK